MAKNNRSVTITDAIARPRNEKEMQETLQMTANALLGTHGDGEWDCGVAGATCYYHKYAQFWNAKVSLTFSGTVIISFPFTIVDSILKQIKDDGTTTNVYVSNAKQVTLTGSGKYILELFFVKNVKEV